MTGYLRIPRLYPEMEEATIGRWLLPEGASLSAGMPVVEIITEKVAYEVEAPEDAAGWQLLVQCLPEKSVVSVGSVLGVIGEVGTSPDAIPDWRAENQKQGRPASTGNPGALTSHNPTAVFSSDSPPMAQISQSHVGAPSEVIRATPSARRAAKAAGVNLEEVRSVAVGTTLTEADVQRFLEKRQP